MPLDLYIIKGDGGCQKQIIIDWWKSPKLVHMLDFNIQKK